jgi:hypothetical protein
MDSLSLRVSERHPSATAIMSAPPTSNTWATMKAIALGNISLPLQPKALK